MLAYQLRRLRINKGLSQAQLGELINVSSSAISMYEQGRREPGVSTLVQIATTFDISLDYLITGSACKAVEEKASEFEEWELCPCSTCYWKKYK